MQFLEAPINELLQHIEDFEMKTKPNYKLMGDKVNSCILMNGGKIMPSIFIFVIIFIFISNLWTIPYAAYLSKTSVSQAIISGNFSLINRAELVPDLTTFILCTLIIILSDFIISFLFFGLVTIMVRIARKDSVSFKFLFIGFYKFKETLPLILILFAQKFAALCFTFLISLVLFKLQIFKNSDALFNYASLSIWLYLIIYCLLVIPFIFLFPSILTGKGYSVKKSVKQSVDVIGGRFFHFTGFIFYSGGRNLINGILSLIISVIMNIKDIQFLSFIFQLSYYVAFMLAFIRMSIAYPVYFLSVTQQNYLKKPDFNIMTPDEVKIVKDGQEIIDVEKIDEENSDKENSDEEDTDSGKN